MISVNNNMMDNRIFSILGKSSPDEKILDSEFFNIFSSMTFDKINGNEQKEIINFDLSFNNLSFNFVNNSPNNEFNNNNSTLVDSEIVIDQSIKSNNEIEVDKSSFIDNGFFNDKYKITNNEIIIDKYSIIDDDFMDVVEDFETLDSILQKISIYTPKIDQSKADELVNSINEQVKQKINEAETTFAFEQIKSFSKTIENGKSEISSQKSDAVFQLEDEISSNNIYNDKITNKFNFKDEPNSNNIKSDIKSELTNLVKNLINQEMNIGNDLEQNITNESKEIPKNISKNEVQISNGNLDNILNSISENEIKNIIQNLTKDNISENGIDKIEISNNNEITKTETPNISDDIIELKMDVIKDKDINNKPNFKVEPNANNIKSDIKSELTNLVKNLINQELNIGNDLEQNITNESKEIPKNISKNEVQISNGKLDINSKSEVAKTNFKLESNIIGSPEDEIKISVQNPDKEILNNDVPKIESSNEKAVKSKQQEIKEFPLEIVRNKLVTDSNNIHSDKINLDNNSITNNFKPEIYKEIVPSFESESSKELIDNSTEKYQNISDKNNLDSESLVKNIDNKIEKDSIKLSENLAINKQSDSNSDNNFSQSNNNSQNKYKEPNKSLDNLTNINQPLNIANNKTEQVVNTPNSPNVLTYISKLEELSTKINTIVSKNIDLETTTARINLSPKSLGTLVVEITQKNDDLKIVINAESKDVANLIEQNIGGLKEKLVTQGINSQNIELNINVQTQTATLMNKGENKEDKGSARQDKKQNKYSRSSEILSEINQGAINYNKYDSGKFIEKYI